MGSNYQTYRNQVHELSDEYARLTGRQGLLYISRPGDGQARYVFGDSDTVKIGGAAALAHITKLLADARKRG